MAENREPSGIAKNPIDLLAEKLGSEWRNLANARAFTQEYLLNLREAFAGLDTEDTSIVVFGYLGRDEATSKSDVDWTLCSSTGLPIRNT
jgi:UTP:GlnB (protein PII) uridylyltransferase